MTRISTATGAKESQAQIAANKKGQTYPDKNRITRTKNNKNGVIIGTKMRKHGNL